MTKEYRYILRNFDLNYEEAKTLSDAENLLQRMHDDINALECECDKDLSKVIDNALHSLYECNPRLNVESALEYGKDKEE